MFTRLNDLVAALVAGLTMIVPSGLVSLQAQVPPTLSPGQQMDVVKWILEQGGLFVVIVVVLYFYRRDFKTSTANQQAQTNALLHVVQANVIAMQELRATTDRMARAVEASNNRRRLIDEEGEERGRKVAKG